MRTPLRIALALFAFAPFVTAQHTVNIGGNWVLNSTISTPPQNNSDSMVVIGGQAGCNAQADSATCSIAGLAQSIIGAAASANTAASGTRQSSYSVMGPLNGFISCNGSASAAGNASAGGGASGSFLCRAKYSNSVGVNVTVRARYTGGLVLLTTPKTFSVTTLGINYSFSSSTTCNVQVQTGGAGSSIAVSANAGAQSVTDLS